MRSYNLSRSLAALAVLTTSSLTGVSARGQPGAWLRGSTEPIDLPGGSRVEFHQMPSEALEGDAGFSVFLPPSYRQGTRSYPVVYFLHGLFNDHTSWTMDRHGDIPALLDERMAKGDLREMVLVHPDGGRSFYTNYHDGSLRYEDFVVDELPRHIEKHYRVSPGAEHRAIAGTSMGGYGALKIAMRHPDRYAAVAAHSPIVFPVDNPMQLSSNAPRSRQFDYLESVFATIYGEPFDQKYFDENNPLKLAARPGLDRLGIYFDYGTADRYDRRMGLSLGLRKLDRTLTENGVNHTFREHRGEPHGWALVYDHIMESLAFLATHLSED